MHRVPDQDILVPVELVRVVTCCRRARLLEYPLEEDVLAVEESAVLAQPELFAQPRAPDDVLEEVVVLAAERFAVGEFRGVLGLEVAERAGGLQFALGLGEAQ